MKRLLAALLLTTGCSNESEPCVFDADCPVDFACEAQECVAVCVSDDDCAGDLVCGPGINTVSRICQPFGNTPFNNTWPNNIEPPEDVGTPSISFAAAVIVSTTTDDDACNSAEPGPDVFGIAIENASGVQLGWAQVEFADVTVTGNDHANSSVLDGEAPDIDPATSCPDGLDGHVVSLGCDDKHVVVSFVDRSGDELAFDPSVDILRVYEWSTQCDPAALVDTYEVRLCRDAELAWRGDLSSCSQQLLTDASGESTAPR